MALSIAIIYGSVRTQRRGLRVAKFIEQQCRIRGYDTTLIDPKELPLPLLDKMYKEYDKGTAPKEMEEIAKTFQKADAFIWVAAEYNHSIPAALKNLIDHYMDEYFYKPSGIVCYSKGPFGGVRAAMTLRKILPEVGTISIPRLFPISNIEQSLNEEGTAIDEAYNKRVIPFLEELQWYAEALKVKRENNI